ncbi:MAG: hypothetical protein SF051_14700 [Elusimicrobiota bacterium]|nr:hypothetical protein [Elusimicrobiota bacterium]
MKAALPLFLILLASCREEPIVRVKSPKETPVAAAAGTAPAAVRGPRWKTPKGWKERGADGMRAATLLPPGGGVEVTVIALPGDVGGELANVNRWRGQIGLPPLEEAGLAEARQTLRSRLGDVSLYEFTGGGTVKTRLAAGVLRLGDTTWFFKLMGPDAPASAARPAFIELLKGLHGDAL